MTTAFTNKTKEEKNKVSSESNRNHSTDGHIRNSQHLINKEGGTNDYFNHPEQISSDIDKALFETESSLPSYPEYCWTIGIEIATRVIQYWAAV
eukprot:872904-Ditylum_brightwellii.AAC.1